jgi:oxygen-independent coproporphyrinogen-3 oxidase
MQQLYLSDEPISTIYFGGGTPSLLTPGEIKGILSTIDEFYQVVESTEITLETNPDDLTIDYLKGLYEVGVNRLSIGIQSFQESVLPWMNRAHDSEQAISSVEISRSVGFDNINIDLIYGIPLSEHNLQSDLMKAVELQPEHISAYNLTIEPGTVFGHQLKKGTLQEVSDEEAAECFELTMTTLKANGYQHYEISNFCLSGKES